MSDKISDTKRTDELERLLSETPRRTVSEGFSRRVMNAVADQRTDGPAPLAMPLWAKSAIGGGLAIAAALVVMVVIAPGPRPADQDSTLAQGPTIRTVADQAESAIDGGFEATRKLVFGASGAASGEFEAMKRDTMLVARRFGAAIDMASKPFSSSDL